MIERLTKQLEKRKTLWKIWHDSWRLKNSTAIKEIYKTRYFDDNATQIRARILQIVSRQIVDLRDEKMLRKSQFHSNFEVFITVLSSFQK